MKYRTIHILSLLVFSTLFFGCDFQVETSTSSNVIWQASEDSSISGSIEFLGEKEEYSLRMSKGHLYYNNTDYGPCEEGDNIKLESEELYINGNLRKPVESD